MPPFAPGLSIQSDFSAPNFKYYKDHQVLKIGGDTSVVDQNVCLDLSQSTKPVSLPKMTQTQIDAMTAPAQGMSVFNTTTQSVQTYSGTSFQDHGQKSTGTQDQLQKSNGDGTFSASSFTESNGTLSGQHANFSGDLYSASLSVSGPAQTQALTSTSGSFSSDVSCINMSAANAVTADSLTAQSANLTSTSTNSLTVSGDTQAQTINCTNLSSSSNVSGVQGNFSGNVSATQGNFTGKVTCTDLVVNGTTTTVNTQELEVADNLIKLNSTPGNVGNDTGIYVNRHHDDKQGQVGTEYNYIVYSGNMSLDANNNTLLMNPGWNVNQDVAVGWTAIINGVTTTISEMNLGPTDNSLKTADVIGVYASGAPVVFRSPDYVDGQIYQNTAMVYDESENRWKFGYTADSADSSSLTYTGASDVQCKDSYCENLVASSGIHQTSDERKKSQIKDLDERAVEVCRHLQPKQYVLNDSQEDNFGFIAQATEELLKDHGFKPEMVVKQRKTEQFEDERSLNYVALVPMMLAYIQSLEKRLDLLEA